MCQGIDIMIYRVHTIFSVYQYDTTTYIKLLDKNIFFPQLAYQLFGVFKIFFVLIVSTGFNDGKDYSNYGKECNEVSTVIML